MSDIDQDQNLKVDVLEVRNRQIAAVHSISRHLSSTLDLDDRLRDILNVSLKAVQATAGTIYVHHPETNSLVFQFVVGDNADKLVGRSMKDTEGVVGSVFHSSKGQITNEPDLTPDHSADVENIVGFATKSIMTVPLKFEEGTPVGVMQVLNKQVGAFDFYDLEVLEIIASIAASAIQNAHLAKEAQMAAVAHAVGDLSHDIKNKMTPISLAVDTLQPTVEKTLSDLDLIIEDAPETVAEQIRAATNYLRMDYIEQFSMIQDQVKEVQTFTQRIADAQKGAISEPLMEPHDLNEIILKEMKSLSHVAARKNINIVTNLSDIPVFKFDKFSVERAIYNLVNNSIPETPDHGTITVSATSVTNGTFPEGEYVSIEVSDNGRGMPQNVLKRILSGDAKSTKVGGTGLGTRIVFNAVRAHHGEFTGESKENVGTTFRLKLPLLREEDKSAIIESE